MAKKSDPVFPTDVLPEPGPQSPDLVAEAERVFAEDLLPETPPADPDTGEVIADAEEAEEPEAEPAKEAEEAKEEREPRGQDIPEESIQAAERVFGLPRDEVFVTVQGGGKYLPARRRVQWMRGEIEQHPDWTIETREIRVVEGTLTVKGRRGRTVDVEIAGGYARIEANIYDETGRLIASGRKTEHSERFLDFVEKAETGAIARALAVAGYGTEAALDLDEGYEDDRIADAPIGSGGRPISITASAIQGVGVGGRTSHLTDAQLAEIARLTRELGIGSMLTTVIEAATEKPLTLPASAANDPKATQQAILAHLRSLSFEEGGKIVQALQRALAKKEAGDGQ